MDGTKGTYDRKSMIVSACIVVALSVCYLVFLKEAQLFIRLVLESKVTFALAWIIPCVVFLMHYFKHKEKAVHGEVIITKRFGVFADNALGGLVYGTMITTAITLLKGLYIQTVLEDGVYFTDLGKVDVVTVFTGLAFLLYHAVVKVIDAAKETYRVEHTEQVLNDKKQVVIPSDSEQGA